MINALGVTVLLHTCIKLIDFEVNVKTKIRTES